MKKKIYLLFTLFFINSVLFSLEPLSYSLNSTITSYSPNFFKLNVKQQIDFDCQVDTFCPIGQSPEKMTLTFRRIQGDIHYNDKEYHLDTENNEPYSLEFQCVKKLLNTPIHITLSSGSTISEKVQDFEHILSLSTLENYFISDDLLKQIVELIFLPLSAKNSEQKTALSLYYPFKTRTFSSFELKEEKESSSMLINEPLAIEGLYSTHQEPFSVHLNGQLEAKAKWTNKSPYCESLTLSHALNEKKGETLFENPLSFEYSVSLNMKK